MSLIVYQAAVVCVGALLAVLATIAFFRRIQLPRPAIGTFNGRDIVVLFVFIVTLPVLYLTVPHIVLTLFLCLTFSSALYMGYQRLVPKPWLWAGIIALMGTDIALAAVMGHSVGLWQAYWIVNSAMVMLAAASVANLYIQGGMRLRHVAWFALGLAVYDPLFSIVIPITDQLANRFAGFALTRRWASGSARTARTSASATCWSSPCSCWRPTPASAAGPPTSPPPPWSWPAASSRSWSRRSG
jgi:hypothetical protein